MITSIVGSRRWLVRVLSAVIALVVGGCTANSAGLAPHPAARSASPSPAGHPITAPVPAPALPTLTPTAALPAKKPAKPFISPIQPDNRPTSVAGDTNGEMPSKDLVGVAPNCQAYRPAGPSLGLLMATARDQGVILGTEQCYRPLSDQVAVKKTWTARGNSACAAPVLTTPTGKPKGTSMHGWGKAADLSDAAGTLTFGSPTYRFLTAQAGRFGWNHPGWAEPGGSVCPEPWHWEWVGDGGILGVSPIVADVVTLLPTSDGLGYSIVTGLGAVRRRGDALDQGSLTGSRPAWLVAGACRTPNGAGYWLVGVDGSVYAFGAARNFGSTAAHPPAQPVIGIAPTADGAGYWLASADGRVFGFGASGSYGSPAASKLNLGRPIVAIAATPDGRGYWLAAADGKVFAYGGAVRYGQASGRHLPAPVVAMATTPDGRGYWLAGADGSVYPFGDARTFGSTAHKALREPVTAIAPTPDGSGYWLVAADGSVFAFGDSVLYVAAPDGRVAARLKSFR